MGFTDLIVASSEEAAKTIVDHAPTIGVCVGIGGFIGTIFMVNRVAPKAKAVCDEIDKEYENDDITDKEIFVKKAKAVAPMYAMPAIVGIGSAICIGASYGAKAKEAAGLAVSMDILASQYERHRNEVEKILGEEKAQKIHEEVSSHIEEDMKPIKRCRTHQVIPQQSKQLFWDSLNGSFFYSTIEDILRAQSELRTRLYEGSVYVSHNEFKECLDAEQTVGSDDLVWTNPRDIEFWWPKKREVADDGISCYIPLMYTVPPKRWNGRLHEL